MRSRHLAKLILLAIPGCASGPAAAPTTASAGTDLHSDPPIWPATLPTLRWTQIAKDAPESPREAGSMPTRADFVTQAKALLMAHYGPFAHDTGLKPEDERLDADPDLPTRTYERSTAIFYTWRGLRVARAMVVYQAGTQLTVGHADTGELVPEAGSEAPLLPPATIRSKVAEVLKLIGLEPSRAEQAPLRLEFVEPFDETSSWALSPVWMLVPGPFYVDARTGEPGRFG
jgi:hypothetical protein